MSPQSLTTAILAAAGAFLSSAALTPIVGAIARRKGAVAKPKADRWHTKPTAMFGGVAIEVIDTPGHTLGHVTYSLPSAATAFVGDTLFAVGCGRVIEGTMEMMWSSLEKLMALPDETAVYCGHEYTEANIRFALTIEPDNADLLARAAEVKKLRAAGKASLPTAIGLEKRTNPFLRLDDPGIRARLGLKDAQAAAVFGEIRRRKDSFK